MCKGVLTQSLLLLLSASSAFALERSSRVLGWGARFPSPRASVLVLRGGRHARDRDNDDELDKIMYVFPCLSCKL